MPWVTYGAVKVEQLVVVVGIFISSPVSQIIVDFYA